MDRKIVEEHLPLEEYKKVIELLGREPNLVELGVFSAMWSEHCSYKSSRLHLKKFPTKAPWVVQGPGENAGVILVDEEKGICAVFKVESHNHPSYIEPFHGAATGVGGIVRDVFTMGARPVALADSLRFGEIEKRFIKDKNLRKKMKYLVKGVVSGISHYGNCLGLPTVAGDTYFDFCYQTNPLVNVFCLGYALKDKIFYARASGVGNKVLYVGNKTGRDGIKGAVMASEEFEKEEENSKKVKVQIGDPFIEKLLMEATLEAMEKDCILAIQDMGAAGLTSSSVEMASRGGVGIKLELDKVPTREKNMTPYELLLSESQERMLIIAKPGKEKEIEKIFKKYGLEATIIGEIIKEPRFICYFKQEKVCDLPVDILTEKAPVYFRPMKKPKYLDKIQNLDIFSIDKYYLQDDPKSILETLGEKEYQKLLLKSIKENFPKVAKELLKSPTIASKRWIYEQYDHMVQTNTVVYPGSDAAVLRIKFPKNLGSKNIEFVTSKKGVAISADCNSRYVFLDPYEGGKIAVAEAARNVVCSGAKPLAITNCLNFASPEDPEIMYQFVKATDGMAEACKILQTPVVSGNVSFYNETKDEKPEHPFKEYAQKRAIFPTPLVVCVGVLNDVKQRLTKAFKQAGNYIVLLGLPEGNISGSEYQKLITKTLSGKPKIDLNFEKRLQDFVLELHMKNLLESAHDVSEGGLFVSLCEMAFGDTFNKEKGFEININSDIRPDFLYFGEDQSLILIEVKPEDLNKVLNLAYEKAIPFEVLGQVKENEAIISYNHEIIFKEDIKTLKEIYEKALENALSED